MLLHRLRGQLAKMDPDAFEQSAIELDRVRQEALGLITPVLKRLASSLYETLVKAVLDEEVVSPTLAFLTKGHLRTSPLVAALLSRWNLARIRLEWLDPGNAIGAIQHFCSDETGTPFEWLPPGFSFAPGIPFAEKVEVRESSLA